MYVAFKHTDTTKPVTTGKQATGAAMDRPLPQRRRPLAVWAVAAALILGALTVVFRLIPHGLRISESDIRVATAMQGMFHNDVVVRSTAEPLHTIMLDALESGRVEEVLINDGAQVAKGTLLFRLSNPQLRLNLVAREADRAQQVSNLLSLRIAIEQSQTEHQRRMLDLNFARAQAERQYTRSEVLVKPGAISKEAFDDSRDRLDRQRQALEQEEKRNLAEMRIKRDGVRQMSQAVQQLDDGLKVVNDSIDSLAVRAPITGRLTDFRLQLGEIVKAEQRVGRIDDPSQFKLIAQIDEYFLGRVVGGKKGFASVNGRHYDLEVSHVYPQIKDGRFLAELLFTGAAPPEMNPGQSAETEITLGGSSTGLIIPNDAFLSDTGGAWAFVLTPDGQVAERRNIRTGRRNSSQVEVTAGVAAGERVIVSAYTKFGTAERLQIVP